MNIVSIKIAFKLDSQEHHNIMLHADSADENFNHSCLADIKAKNYHTELTIKIHVTKVSTIITFCVRVYI